MHTSVSVHYPSRLSVRSHPVSVSLCLCLSVCLSVSVSLCVSLSLSLCLCFYLSLCLSLCLSVCLSVSLPYAHFCLGVYSSTSPVSLFTRTPSLCSLAPRLSLSLSLSHRQSFSHLRCFSLHLFRLSSSLRFFLHSLSFPPSSIFS